jgi:hypothetical protein
LLDVLPVSPSFPGVLADSLTGHEPKAVGAAESESDLVGLGVTGLCRGNANETGTCEHWVVLGAKSGFGAFGTLKVLSIITE